MCEETYSQEGLECPYCGYIDTDAWELLECGDAGHTECPSCEKKYKYDIEQVLDFIATPLKEMIE